MPRNKVDLGGQPTVRLPGSIPAQLCLQDCRRQLIGRHTAPRLEGRCTHRGFKCCVAKCGTAHKTAMGQSLPVASRWAGREVRSRPKPVTSSRAGSRISLRVDTQRTARQKKTGRPVRFELSEQTRQAVDDYLKASFCSVTPRSKARSGISGSK